MLVYVKLGEVWPYTYSKGEWFLALSRVIAELNEFVALSGLVEFKVHSDSEVVSKEEQASQGFSVIVRVHDGEYHSLMILVSLPFVLV